MKFEKSCDHKKIEKILVLQFWQWQKQESHRGEQGKG